MGETKEKPKFEDALAQLEKIVAEMEAPGNLSLDEMLERFERGRKLEAFCIAELESIRKRIEKVVTQTGTCEPMAIKESPDA